MRTKLSVLALASTIICTHAFADPNKPDINYLQSHYPNNPAFQQIINHAEKKANDKAQLSNSTLTHLKNYYQYQHDVMAELQKKINQLNLEQNVQNTFIPKINNNDKTTTKSFNKIEQNDPINFLNLQLSDAIIMLQAVQVSANNTANILESMKLLAMQALNGTYSDQQRNEMNMQFQALKSGLHYIQSIDLINGEKLISGGDITIQIGNEKDTLTTYLIKIPAFDTRTLSLDELSIANMASADNANSILNQALDYMMTVITAANMEYINDAQAMLASIPSNLAESYQLLSLSRDICLRSANGVYNNNQRALFNIYFDYLKAAMNQTQTYISLNGPKSLGGGTIHIQIGQHDSPENTLNIKLPIVDPKKLELDKLTVTTQTDSYHAMDVMVKSLRDFVYLD